MKKILLIKVFVLSAFFLIAQDFHRPEIHCKHFFYGYPYGTPQTNDLIIRDIYALSNNDDTKFADWVCYRLDRQTISGESKKRNWKADPWLDEDETLEPYPDDYKNAYATLNTDRGHLAPLASFDGSPYWYETNYFSNITPQKSVLNRGVWARLEGRVRDLVYETDIAYVMTGTLYEREMPSLPKADEPHRIPSGYWKIVIYEDKNGTINAAGFVFEQETPRNVNMQDYVCTIDEIEQRSNLDFLWMLEEEKEHAIESAFNNDFIQKFFSE